MNARPEMPPLWQEYTTYRTAMIEATRLGKLAPARCADQLEKARVKFGAYICQWEIDAYRRSPDDWRGVVLP